MRSKRLFSVALLCAVLVFLLDACATNPAAPVPTNPLPSAATKASASTLPADVSVQEAAKLRDSGAFVLDVREPSEWNEFHIPNATLIPLGQLERRAAEVPKDKPILVVCRSGNRSATGRNILRDAGFKNVTSMSGGMTEWSKAGLPTVTGP